jgi:hypothetical protein
LAIVWAIKHFHHYLSRPFTIVTDHAALKWLKTSKMPKGRRARWIMELQQHHFTIKHRAGKHNANADALSRMYDKEQLNECFINEVDTEEEIQWNDNIQNERENEWHISSENEPKNDEERWFEEELMQQFFYTPLITVIGYESPKDEMEEIYRTNIKVKQVIANQPITKGGS